MPRGVVGAVVALLMAVVAPASAANPLTVLAIADPDQFSWTLFTQVVAPSSGSSATFQSWASNRDTFSLTPTFPTGPERSVLAPLSIDGTPGTVAIMANGSIDVQEVRRNRPAFDFITGANHGVPLVTQADLVAAYKSQEPIIFPDDAIEVKAVWWPLSVISAAGNDPSHYFQATDDHGRDIALVALHIFTKALPNWTWATFEQEDVPGRCDFLKCLDSFGAVEPEVAINDSLDESYGACLKTPALIALFKSASLPDVWQHYCLKGSQVDFVDPTGVPSRLGNIVIERPVIQTSSCMTCHARAAIDANGQNVYGFGGLSAVECNGFLACSPNGAPVPQWFYKSAGGPIPRLLAFQTDFAYSIPFCALPATPAPPKPGC